MDVSKVISGSSYAPQTNSGEVNIGTENKTLQQKTLYTQARKSGVQQGSELVNKADIEGMVEGLNEFLQPINTSIKFEFHDKLDRYYVKVIDSVTKELIREIPPKQMLDMYAAMAEFMGLIVDEKI
ncbi:flagellar protein FlaG [Amphibacillus sp. MSJ-3]|uniref:flagellar protein FlaG n=1 Tax=Amphibacillus sp. MSJ-3 TaxID=2841505 RepID=UPI001C0F1DF4|nr:flagellar protein FlaG [Amphibacillus sp. MSJ-3]MBU5593944.1 flagellar protein FlaG [Amphibacillus sp. MSJ-3]